MRVVVDMHVVDNLPPVQPGSRPRKEDKVKVNVRYVKQIDFAPLRGYLEGRNDFIPTCLEAISKLRAVHRHEFRLSLRRLL